MLEIKAWEGEQIKIVSTVFIGFHQHESSLDPAAVADIQSGRVF